VDDRVLIEVATSQGFASAKQRPVRHSTDFNNDSTLTSAILDRVLHHADTVIIGGKSFQLAQYWQSSPARIHWLVSTLNVADTKPPAHHHAGYRKEKNIVEWGPASDMRMRWPGAVNESCPDRSGG
jgi:hypothetical protein